MKLCEYIDNCLKECGIKKVFGVPGWLIMPIWQSITSAELVLCSSEQEAGYIACGYAKMSREPVAVITTGGTGALNCVSGMASANMDSLPIIFISGKTPTQRSGSGLLQEESGFNRHFDSQRVTEDITKFSHTLTNDDLSKGKVRRYFFCAFNERKGSIHLSVPVDLQNKEISDDYETCNEPANQLCSKKPSFSKPLIVMGWGAWMADATNEIYNFAKAINAPVLVSSKACCCSDPSHQNYLGSLGYSYNRIIDDFLKLYACSDVIVFGSTLGERDIKASVLKTMLCNTRFHFVTNDPTSVNEKAKNVFIYQTNHMKAYVSELLENIFSPCIDEKLINAISKVKLSCKTFWRQKVEDRDYMSKTILALSKTQEKFVVTADAGNHLLATSVLFEPKSTGYLFIDFGIRAMGYGICSTVGMAIADNSKTYIAVTGDGCMLMNGNVMYLAKKYNLPIVFLVFNNQSLGRVRIGQSTTGQYQASDIHDIDFKSYANTFGLDVYQYNTVDEFESSISSVIQKRSCALVEVITDKDEIPVCIKDNIF